MSRPRVLVVGEQPVIALAIRDALSELGAEMVGPCATLGDALRFAATEYVDAALLDAWLGGRPSYSVGDILADRKIPFVVMSGGDVRGEPESFRHASRLPKPFTRAELLLSVCLLLPKVR